MRGLIFLIVLLVGCNAGPNEDAHPCVKEVVRTCRHSITSRCEVVCQACVAYEMPRCMEAYR